MSTLFAMEDLIREWRGETVIFAPERGLVFPERRTLMVADLHLGKARTFRKHGIPVAEDACEETLERLASLIRRVSCDRVVILGDLFHHHTGMCGELVEDLLSTVSASGVEMKWVVGNHDRWSGIPQRLGAWCESADNLFSDLQLQHEPGATTLPSVCGHLHPGIAVPGGRGLSRRMPCFWVQPRQIVLPAFSRFTGTSPVEISAADWYALPLENQVCALDGRALLSPISAVTK